ncbi:type IV pilus modification protein PilV [Caenimonas koreensis DSM 17982]|uniref:Type IV pilus modification protein PilV n=1 Tax=Caenimonas koreensis DSM 17982 TaxID=1121255 RepID=A0A844ATG0_9BURK|nr:type IV pilus modification protein PilV [Caenimonas koreensis]MRD47394.1 type IV pilus modification protein PilV [Caenimonas koreensis DSM 17982]
MKTTAQRQAGASLIEVLVAVLILSFGMLALGGMLAYAVQLPRLSAYRAAAVTIAAAHIERMRANTVGFANGSYNETMSFRQPLAPSACAYPNCTPDTMATADRYDTNLLLRHDLPGEAGLRMVCNGGDCSTLEGDVWVMWTEPATLASLSAANSDECPLPGSAPAFAAFIAPAPRCLHIKFKL